MAAVCMLGPQFQDGARRCRANGQDWTPTTVHSHSESHTPRSMSSSSGKEWHGGRTALMLGMELAVAGAAYPCSVGKPSLGGSGI